MNKYKGGNIMDGYDIVNESVKKPIREIVKDPEWQKVRTRLVGRWKSSPEWCCSQLKSYLWPVDKATEDQLRIMMNYLTGSGFRMGKIKHKCIQDIRDKVSAEMKARKVKR
jgi:hypothetical protein